MVINLARRLRAQWRARRLKAWIQPGDTPNFALPVARQRKLGTRIGKGVRLIGKIDAINPQLVTIGDYCVIGTASALLAHCPIRGGAPVCLGNFVYVSYGVLVLPGVTIGDYVIIGAGSVVTRDVPSGVVIAGNPARVLRDLTFVEQAQLEDTLVNNRRFGEDGTQARMGKEHT